MNCCRLKLRRLLQESNLYRLQLLLGKIKDTDLYAECAILYGKVITPVHTLFHCVIDSVIAPPPSVWPHLFCGAGHEKRRG